jgi:hypothetical protein
MNNKIQLRFGIITLMILVAALSRLLPHPPNFTPIAAMGLFGAAHFSRKYLAFLVPFAALWISSFLLNNLFLAKMYPDFYGEGIIWFDATAPYVFGAFALIIGLGFLMLRKVKVSNLFMASIAASVVFFLVTNAGSWLGNPMYSKDLSGLMAAYTAGVPFFWSTLLGDLFYVGIMFGSYALIKRQVPALQKA